MWSRTTGTFQYWHLAATVVTGLPVVADRTILGRIRAPADHVHLAEIDGFKTHNPVDPGHLEPYQDHTAPRIVRLGFRGIRNGIVSPNHVTGTVHIVASARNMPPLPVRGAWLGFPLTPVLVAWRMTTASGVRVVPETIVVDTPTAATQSP